MYKLEFDTLVVDCEGCFADSFRDRESLRGIHTVLIEHDFRRRVDLINFYNLMMQSGFRMVDQYKKGDMNWGVIGDPFFVTVWKR